MTQKVLRVGSSAAVTLSPDVLSGLKLKVGDEVHVEFDRTKGVAAIRSAHQVGSTEVLAWTKKFIQRYRPALEALAKE